VERHLHFLEARQPLLEIRHYDQIGTSVAASSPSDRNIISGNHIGVEIQGGHRLVTFQVDTLVLNGVDEAADRVAAFAQALFAAIDGRPITPAGGSKRSAPAPRPAAKGAAKPATKTAASRALAVQTTGDAGGGRGSSSRTVPG
jgi:hypothetical protein